jgi:hypothetical protein
MRVVATKSSKDNLCNYCQLSIPSCPKANHLKFGDGVGNDNVIECSEFLVKQFHNNFPIEGKPEYWVIKRAEDAPQKTAEAVVNSI